MWWDFFKVFQYAFTSDPLSRKDYDSGAGTPQADAIPDLRAGGGGGGAMALRDTNELVDMSTVTNRMHRYKEYERLRNMPEIEMAMTVFADEACVAGDTKIATPTYGFQTIEWLVENVKDDRFLVYCWDFQKEDYVLGWAYAPRKTKTAKTIRIVFDDGTYVICTPDHRILDINRKWKESGNFKTNDEVIAFHRVNARTSLKNNQFPRVYTHTKGWVHERQFIDEWRLNRDLEQFDEANQYCRMIAGGMTTRQISEKTKLTNEKVQSIVEKYGMTNSELKYLSSKKKEGRRIIGIFPGQEIDVYDLSVEQHENFCTDWGVVHNCQRDEDGRVLKIITKNESIKEELEFLLFHRKMLNLDQKKVWNKAKNLFINGDFFEEIVINPSNPKEGVKALVPLPADSMYRIETTKGRVVEFQQSKEGPDYQSLSRVDVSQATDSDLSQATAIRFAVEQVVHTKIGDDRKTFYPYGVSLIEAARGPAHQLRLMEDAMVVYRLCLTGDARVRTDKGWKYIKDIQVGNNTFSLDHNLGLVNSKVTFFVNNGVQDVYRLRSDHLEIIGTETHPVLINRDNVIQMVDIKDIIPGSDKMVNVFKEEGNTIAIPKDVESRWSEWGRLNEEYRNTLCLSDLNYLEKQILETDRVFPKADILSVCDTYNLDISNIETRVAGKNIPIDSLKLPDFVDEDFASLFGFLIGDGHIRSTGDNSFTQVDFTTGVNEEINQKYALLLNKFFGHCSFSKDKRSKNGGDKYVVSSRAACMVLLRMGFIPKSENKRIPSWVFSAKPEIRKAFVKGLADADACIRNLKTGLWTAEFALCNKELIGDIKEVWHSCGLASGQIRERFRKGEHEIEPGRIMPDSISYEVYISENQLPRYEKVRSISYAGREDVYDFEVNLNEHNFVVNGTCTSNTRAPERRIFYIDVQSMSSSRAEAFIERMKDQFKKKKVSSSRGAGAGGGASGVEERWHAPAADEDYWIPIRPNNNTRIETLPGACLSLDTKIPLLDGTNDTLQDVINRWNNGEKLWAYSCNPKTGGIVPGLVTWAGITRRNTSVMKIVLDNGESIICTPDHKFPVIEKGFVECKNLQPGDSLIPFNTRMQKIRPSHNNEYVQVYNSQTKKWVFAHRLVAEFFRSIRSHNEQVFEIDHSDKNTIHHKDFNRFNNNPENLYWMNGEDHMNLHQWLSSEYCKIGGMARSAQLADWKEKNDPRYNEFVQKSSQGFANWRNQISPEERKYVNSKISNSLKDFWFNLTSDERTVFEESLKERGITGNQVLRKLLKDPCFNTWFGDRVSKGFDSIRGTKVYEERSKKISQSNSKRWSNVSLKETAFRKQRLVYPKAIMDFVRDKAKQGFNKNDTIFELNNQPDLIELFKSSNTHLKRKNVRCDKITKDRFDKMMKAFGYQNWKQFNDEVFLYNHQIVSVEFLQDNIDTGTLTIDGSEEFHGHHTFALQAGVFTKNSNLGEIDDTVYFRNKLFVALNFPKNYFNNEDPQSTRVSLSAQDVKFARMIERLQSHIEDAIWEICERHLKLRGYPEDAYEDLEVKMTPPSDWRELSRAEVVASRIQNAGSLKGAQIMSDFDILTEWMKYPEDQVKKMLARLKIQKLEELKLQIVAQNPALLGAGVPGDDEEHISTDPSENNPMPGGDGTEPPEPPEGGEDSDPMGTGNAGGSPPPMPQDNTGGQQLGQVNIPQPSEEDIKKYNLDIKDYGQEQDREEIDFSQE